MAGSTSRDSSTGRGGAWAPSRWWRDSFSPSRTLKLFDRARTTHDPRGRPTALILSGPYRFSRNPMYVGAILVVLGVGVLVGTPAMLSCWLAFGWILDAGFIPREEAALEEEFGTPYREYRKQVGRWL